MAEYHVGCGLAGIYAGTVKKNGEEWQNKSCVTDEAIDAVRDWFMLEARDKPRYGFSWKLKDGRTVKLVLEIEDKPKE